MINGQVSHWWEQRGLPRVRPELPGNLSADVAIVGAGYTGLWTAYYLKQAQPGLRVVVIDQRHVGYGASGRNGGWLTNAITGGRELYVRAHGRDAATRFQRAMNDTVSEVIRVAAAEGVDADMLQGGEFNVATTPAQEARLRAFAAAEQEWPHTASACLKPQTRVPRSMWRARARRCGTRTARGSNPQNWWPDSPMRWNVPECRFSSAPAPLH